MRVALIYSGSPRDSLGGGAQTIKGLAAAYESMGWSVTVVFLDAETSRSGPVSLNTRHGWPESANAHDLGPSSAWPAMAESLRGLIAGRLLDGTGLEGLASSYARGLREYLERLCPDLVVGYHWPAVEALSSAGQDFDAILGDPLPLPVEARVLPQYAKYRPSTLEPAGMLGHLRLRQLVWRRRQLMCRALQKPRRIAAFSAYHAQGYEHLINRPVQYMRTPLDVPPLPRRDRLESDRVLHMGHFGGTATQFGLQYLGQEVIPELLRSAPEKRLSMLSGMRDHLPSHFRGLFDSPNVEFLGRVSDLASLFQHSACLLVPIPVSIGVRVRALTAMALGLPVVLHSANAPAIPELVDGSNCLISDKSVDLVQLCNLLSRDPDFAGEMAGRAHRTVSALFDVSSVGQQLAGWHSDKIARDDPGARGPQVG